LASGSFSLSCSNSNVSVWSTYEEHDTDVSNNKSYLNIYVYSRRNNSGYTASGTGNTSVSVDSATQEENGLGYAITSSSDTLLFAKQYEIVHDNDGSKFVKISVGWSGDTPISASGDRSVQLDTIPRASTPTISGSGNIGETIAINTNRASSAFTHTITYGFGNSSGTIATGVTDIAFWTIPKSFADIIPNATSGWGSITCITYNGGSQIGSKTITFTAYVPNTAEFQPTISNFTIFEATAGIAARFGAYIQSRSMLIATTTATGAHSSTISNYSVKVENTSYSGASVTTGVLNTSGNATATVTVTDSRGRTATTTANYSVTAYTPPTISAFTVERGRYVNSIFTPDDEGEAIRAVISASVTALSNLNTAALTIRYGDTSYVTDGTIIYNAQNVDYTYSATIIDTTTFSSDTIFNFVAQLTDFFTTSTDNVSIGTAKPFMDIDAVNNVIAFGTVSKNPNADEIAAPFQFTTPPNTHMADATKYANYNVDVNVAIAPLILSSVSTPTSDPYYITTLFYGGYTSNSNRMQIATPYNGRGNRYTRSYTTQSEYNISGWTAWEYIGTSSKVLYDNASGTTGTITLSETASDFSYFEIFAMLNDNYSSVKICTPNGKKFCITGTWYVPTVCNYAYVGQISGTSISAVLNSSNENGTITSNTNKIIRVIGYR